MIFVLASLLVANIITYAVNCTNSDASTTGSNSTSSTTCTQEKKYVHNTLTLYKSDGINKEYIFSFEPDSQGKQTKNTALAPRYPGPDGIFNTADDLMGGGAGSFWFTVRDRQNRIKRIIRANWGPLDEYMYGCTTGIGKNRYSSRIEFDYSQAGKIIETRYNATGPDDQWCTSDDSIEMVIEYTNQY